MIICPNCGQWYYPNTLHMCPSTTYQPPAPMYVPMWVDLTKTNELLERIAVALEKLKPKENT